MYRQGLGDCFLITFDVGKSEKHMLIDCGTLGSKATGVKVKDVMNHIAETTSDAKNKNGRLEVLVATHAHKDHVSGFLSESGALKQFRVDNVWMGWTEDPADPLAKKLGKIASAMRVAVERAFAMPGAGENLKRRLEGVSEFEGAEVVNGNLAMGVTIAQALEVLRKLDGAQVDYQSPGEPAIEVAEIPGFRFYVLGPPRDAEKLSSMGDHDSDSLYGLASALSAHAGPGDLASLDAESPFDARFCFPIEQADRFCPDYSARYEKYRRIDGQWLESAAELASKLDRFRNNTSLALAIERIGDGQVLLFPADAQEGNWLSWHDPAMRWEVKNHAGEKEIVTASDLLSRTVFYKVGHHSSHNATVNEKGLELMRQNKKKKLVAFIPVDREVALGKSPAGSWRMPAVALYRELLEACDGRVVRADLGWAADANGATRPAIEKELQDLATVEEWKRWTATQAKTKNVDIQPLYIEYRLD